MRLADHPVSDNPDGIGGDDDGIRVFPGCFAALPTDIVLTASSGRQPEGSLPDIAGRLVNTSPIFSIRLASR
jgi:hypothetical protein